MPDRLTGTVLEWHRKGYGKIQPDGTRKVCFVHYSFIKDGRELEVGERVGFSIERTDRGLRALEVERI
jgi:cold shock CspA family protein